MDQRIGAFRLGDAAGSKAPVATAMPKAAPSKRPVVRKPVLQGTARAMQGALAVAVDQEDWQEF
jgi:hypothetical protein